MTIVALGPSIYYQLTTLPLFSYSYYHIKPFERTKFFVFSVTFVWIVQGISTKLLPVSTLLCSGRPFFCYVFSCCDNHSFLLYKPHAIYVFEWYSIFLLSYSFWIEGE